MEPKTTKLAWLDIYNLIQERLPKKGLCYGVPRGGAIVAGLTGRAVDKVELADFIVDDIIDSGATKEKHKKHGKPFYALVDKLAPENDIGWIEFPWEEPAEKDIGNSVIRLLEFIGEDPNREGLRDTPKRFIKALQFATQGYRFRPNDVLSTTFGSDGYDELVLLKGIEFYSTCEHHLAVFSGVAHVGYIPNKRVVGLSKLARLVDMYAQRLQIQERMTVQIANAIEEHLQPKGVAVALEARHFCMLCRGVEKQNSSMVTSALRGAFKKQTAARSEFFSAINLAKK